jgi:hypothetical protein
MKNNLGTGMKIEILAKLRTFPRSHPLHAVEDSFSYQRF